MLKHFKHSIKNFTIALVAFTTAFPWSITAKTTDALNSRETMFSDTIATSSKANYKFSESLREITLPDGSLFSPSNNINADLIKLGDTSHKIGIAHFAIPAGIFATAALFVKTPKLVQAREWVQENLSQHGKHKTEVDDYIQYLPMVAGYGLDFCGVHSQHRVLDRTILLAMSYATFAVVNLSAKKIFKEQRPDSEARNSFPSGHTGTAFVGAEFMRREYWNTNKWIASSGYLVATLVAYLRIHNDRHWINDVVGGAALGYLSTTFAYWLYPKIFKKRAIMHRDALMQDIDATYNGNTKNNEITCIAAPFASEGTFGVSASITF